MNNFKNFFTNGVSYARLEEGCYPAKVVGMEFVDPTPETLKLNPEASGYVKVSYVLQRDSQPINENRFEKGFSIFISQIKQQLGLENSTLSMPELFAVIMNTPINIYVSYKKVETEVYRNISLLPPVIVPVAVPKEEVTEDEVY